MSHQRFVFRADASLDIGTGHVMRCLTLAEALRERGANCRFVCREHPGNLFDLLRQRGFDAHALPPNPCVQGRAAGDTDPAHAAWLGTDWATDALQTLSVLAVTPVDWLVVDHYALDARWERTVRSACRRLMVIDDLADRPHDCDLLLDQNLGRSAADYAGLVAEHSTILAGPRYALLRPDFASLRSYSLARRASPRFEHLLVTMGGVDKDNATGRILEALKNCSLPNDCRITAVMGPHAPWLGEVRAQAAKMPWATEVRVNAQDMAKLMAESDLAVGAAGSTSWERCALALPTLMVILADNQREAGRELAASGAVELLQVGDRLESALPRQLERLISDSLALRAMADRAAAICDGQGASQVAERLMAP